MSHTISLRTMDLSVCSFAAKLQSKKKTTRATNQANLSHPMNGPIVAWQTSYPAGIFPHFYPTRLDWLSCQSSYIRKGKDITIKVTAIFEEWATVGKHNSFGDMRILHDKKPSQSGIPSHFASFYIRTQVKRGVYRQELNNWNRINALTVVHRSFLSLCFNSIGSNMVHKKLWTNTFEAPSVSWIHKHANKNIQWVRGPCLELEIFGLLLYTTTVLDGRWAK